MSDNCPIIKHLIGFITDDNWIEIEQIEYFLGIRKYYESLKDEEKPDTFLDLVFIWNIKNYGSDQSTS